MDCPFIASICLVLLVGATAATAAEKSAVPPPPPLPPITALHLEPSTLTLQDGRDERRVLVWGRTEDGDQIDLTAEANWISESPAIEAGNGSVRPRSAGEGTVRVRVAGK